MSDETDAATELEEKERAYGIARARQALPPASTMRPALCINDCGEPPGERSRFCSAECRDDHESRIKQQKRAGIE